MAYRPYTGSVKKTKQFKSSITAKAKIAKRKSTCNGCGARINPGDNVTVVRHRLRRYHTATCVPQNVTQPPPASPSMPKNAIEAAYAALLSMENALVAKAKQHGITPEIEKSFDRYQKLKAVALRPGSENEGKMALRNAILDIVKMIF